MKTSDFDFELPERLIAQAPPHTRGDSRLMAVDRATGGIRHLRFADLPDLIGRRDAVALNDTLVLPARLHLARLTGARVQALVLDGRGTAGARAMMKPLGKLKAGERLRIEGTGKDLVFEGLAGEALGLLSPPQGMTWEEVLDAHGRPPLPPYIRRPFGEDPMLASDRERYQTVFARTPGSVAAPTAGMHFTPKMLEAIRSKAASVSFVTLDVGPGTFKPVKADTVEEHEMEGEAFSVPAETAEALNRAQDSGGRRVAVGTTVTRALETAAEAGELGPFSGVSRLFIRPPFKFRAVDALVTNFHLPRSTLLMLVSAFAGRELVMEAYAKAVEEEYRFFSFGDACFFY